MNRRFSLSGLTAGLLLALAMPLEASAQLVAREAATTVLGEVCEDLGHDGRCDPSDPALSGVVVRSLRGSWVRTDGLGRFRLPVAGARAMAVDEVGRLRPRLDHLYLFVDARFLGVSGGEGVGQWVDLIPGGTVVVSFALPLERPVGGRAPKVGRETGSLPAVKKKDEALVLEVPVEVRPGHRLLVGEVLLETDSEGRAFVPVRLPGREGITTFRERAPDGQLRVLEVRGLRVPWENGSQLLVHRPVETLVMLDLPPGAVAPGRLRVVAHGEPGLVVHLGEAEPLVLGPEARGERWIEVQGEPLQIVLEREGSWRRELSVALPVDPRLLRTFHLAADLRAGYGDGVFGEGRVDLFGEMPLFGGRLGGGLRLSDARLVEVADRGRPLSLGAGPVYQRVPDPEVAGLVFADEATMVDENPADATLWGGWTGEAGRVVLGSSRTPLVGGEVGRFDRATLGPAVDLSRQVGTARLRLAGAADAWGVPLMDDPRVLPGHAVLSSTGGAFYRLPHRGIAEGSERLWIESLDPSSGLPLDRRLLRRGRDYEIDPESGRVLLAAPLGLSGVALAGRLGERSLGGPSRLVADYHYRPEGPGVGYAAGGLRASIETRKVQGGLQAAGVNAGRYGLLAGDLALEPLEGLALSASFARSAGDSFLVAGGLNHSLDGGERYATSPVQPRESLGGLAAAARLRIGGEGIFGLQAFASLRGEGFADGAGVATVRERALGARLRLGDEALSLRAEFGHREGPDALLTGDLAHLGARLRAQLRLGAFGLALEGGYQSLASTDAAGTRVEGAHASAGFEIGWRASDTFELLVGHLQGFARSGAGPTADDPTFTSVGVRADLPSLGRLEARGGIHLDGRPGLRLHWLAEQAGGARYATFATETDRPWDGQGQASVVGGRQVVDASTDLFAESRGGSDATGAVSAGTAVGGTWGEGPLSLTASYERAAGPGDSLHRLRDGLFLRAGWSGPRLSVSAFGENTRAYSGEASLGFARRSVGGLSLHGRPTDALALGLRLLASTVEGEGVVEEAPALETSGDLVYRPRTGLFSLALLHYGLRADPRVDGAGLWHRRHLARVALGMGRAPGPSLTLAGVFAVDEARRPATGEAPAARALVGTLRGAWPLFERVEPVLEVGLRRLWGAGEELTTPTLRAELLGILGPLRIGLGAAITGFTGEGTEGVTGEPTAPRVYLVLRGAL